MDVDFDHGSVVFMETILEPVEGVGHFEPLRHYAEVHLKIEPIERDSGIEFENKCKLWNLPYTIRKNKDKWIGIAQIEEQYLEDY